MKIETLFRRLAEKTNTPQLEQILKGKAPLTDLPDHCMVWTGPKIIRDKPRFQRRMTTRGWNEWIVPAQPPTAKIVWQGKMMQVQRLLIQLLMKPDYEYRARHVCHTELCVNPLHYGIEPLYLQPPRPVADIPECPEISSEWTREEVDEMVEILLTEENPLCWNDIINTTHLEGAPEDLVREVLKEKRKEHLLR